jgi:hypothetical protein
VVSPSTSTTSARPTRSNSSDSREDGGAATARADVATSSRPDVHAASSRSGREETFGGGSVLSCRAGGAFTTVRVRTRVMTTVRVTVRVAPGTNLTTGAEFDVGGAPFDEELSGACAPGGASGWIAARAGDGSGLGDVP